MAKTFKLPKTLGACVDLLYALKVERLKVEKAAAVIEEQEKKLREHLINELPANDANGVIGRVAKANITVSVEPTAKDWDKTYAYIVKEKAFDLLQKRFNGAACRERWDDGVEIPGVEQFKVKKVSLTKV